MPDNREADGLMARLLLLAALACVVAAAIIYVPKGVHLVTCLDSERPGCPAWCWTCDDAEPCEANGGVRSIKGASFFDNRTEYICKDGTVE